MGYHKVPALHQFLLGAAARQGRNDDQKGKNDQYFARFHTIWFLKFCVRVIRLLYARGFRLVKPSMMPEYADSLTL
jgi:hypothetical protein